MFGAGGLIGWLGGLIGWFGKRSSETARLQKTLLDASREWVEQSQRERAQLNARISDLELEVLQKDGEIRSLKQKRDSLLELLRRSGVAIPGE